MGTIAEQISKLGIRTSTFIHLPGILWYINISFIKYLYRVNVYGLLETISDHTFYAQSQDYGGKFPISLPLSGDGN